jgi:SAM-dependent methyltransferase
VWRFSVYSCAVHYGLVRASLPRDGRLLDAGCGDCGTLKQFLRLEPSQRVLGIELSAQDALACQGSGVTPIIGNLESAWPVAPSSVDVVSANQVIEHLVEPDRFAAESFRVLRPGGTLVVSTENLAAWPNVAALAMGLEPFSTNFSKRYFAVGSRYSRRRGQPLPSTATPHISVPSYQALRDLFPLYGYEPVDAAGIHLAPLPGWLLRRLARVDARHSMYISMSFRKPLAA